MPGFEIAAPPTAYAVVLEDAKGKEYQIDIDAAGFTRAGKDGSEKILSLFMNEEFVGEVLEGHWKKGWDVNISTFTARINGGVLELTGVASGAGTWGSGWINSQSPIPMIDETEITVEMEVPISDTGAVANRDVRFEFYICGTKVETSPALEDDWLLLRIDITDSGLLYVLQKYISGSDTALWDGSTYDGASARDPAADKFTIWRFVFHEGEAGASSPSDVRHMHVYLKQGANRAAAEAATEQELGNGTQDSPYDISDLLFEVGYPAYVIYSKNTTYFGTAIGSANGVDSTYCRVSYPDNFKSKYLTTGPDDYLDGRVRVFDEAGVGGTDESLWNEVFDEDHPFVGDCVIQNGLIRYHMDELSNFKILGEESGWRALDELLAFLLVTDSKNLTFAHLSSITNISPEEVTIEIRFLDSAVLNEDYFIDAEVTLRRGTYSLDFNFLSVFPSQDVRCFIYKTGGPTRWSYVGDDGIGDDDLNVSASNATMTDNFSIHFNDAGHSWLLSLSADLKPDSGTQDKYTYQGHDAYFRDYSVSVLLNVKLTLCAIPFSLIANCFKEAESATIIASTRSYLDGEGNCVDSVCEAQPDRVGGIDIDGDAFGFWNPNDVTVSQMTTYGLKMEGTESSKILVDDIGDILGGWEVNHTYAPNEDWSGEDYIGFWIYGVNSGDTMKLELVDGTPVSHSETWVDNFTGWRWIAFALADFSGGGVDLTDIDQIAIGCGSPSGSASQTYYLDYVNAYTVNTDTLWSADAGAPTIDVSDSAEASVGTYCVKITSAGAGWLRAGVTPTDALGKLAKFDTLKLYLHGDAAYSLRIYLVDADGDSIWSDPTITTGATEYTFDIPHNAADLVTYGWTETGTYDYSTLTKIQIAWNASGAGELVYVDGLREYIGTTTSRGRGETLSNSSAVVLDASNEASIYYWKAGTNLPEGRYICVRRIKDTDQVASDLRLFDYNDDATEYVNRGNGNELKQATSSFAVYSTIFDITADYVTALDDIRNELEKHTTTENTIFIDYFLIIPVGDGEGLPQDLAHGAMQSGDRLFRLPRR